MKKSQAEKSQVEKSQALNTLILAYEYRFFSFLSHSMEKNQFHQSFLFDKSSLLFSPNRVLILSHAVGATLSAPIVKEARDAVLLPAIVSSKLVRLLKL